MRTSQISRLFLLGISTVVVVAVLCGYFPHSAQAQLLAPQEPPNKPTAFGHDLFFQMRDIRLECFDDKVLEDKCTRGVITVCYFEEFGGRDCFEYPAVTNQTVGDFFRDNKLWIKRYSDKPQLRVIQKNAIIQSSIDDPNTVSGFSPQFLQQKINAGDIITVAPIVY